MTLSIGLALVALVVAVLSLVVSLSRKDDRKRQAELDASQHLGMQYARMAWTYARSQPEASDPHKLAKHALDAFILIDKSADGKRDFSDSQAKVLLEACK